jgi:hypothetical protein
MQVAVMNFGYMLHCNTSRGRVVLDTIETIMALAATPSGLVAIGMAAAALVLMRRGGGRRRRTD